MTSFVDLRADVRLAYETAGSGEPALLFVHGWSCDRTYFEPQFTHFAVAHTVAALDLRGHGDSSRLDVRRGTYTIEAFADDVLAVAGAAGLHRPVVVGHSLGGLVALACAARPGAVRAAVMVDSASVFSTTDTEWEATAVAAMAADEDGSWRREFAAGLFLPTDTVRKEEVVAGIGRQPPAIAAVTWKSMSEFDGATALGRVRVPLLMIDPPDDERKLLDLCPTLTFSHVVGAGHFPQLEVPDQVNPMIQRLLDVL